LRNKLPHWQPSHRVVIDLPRTLRRPLDSRTGPSGPQPPAKYSLVIESKDPLVKSWHLSFSLCIMTPTASERPRLATWLPVKCLPVLLADKSLDTVMMISTSPLASGRGASPPCSGHCGSSKEKIIPHLRHERTPCRNAN